MTMNCLTITLNSAVDTTYVLDRLVRGGTNRVGKTFRLAGGTGNNVARVLRSQGHTVTATGFLGGHTGALIANGLTQAGVAPRFVWLETGASRTCHAILEASSGEATEVLEAGPLVTARDCERLLGRLTDLLRSADAVVIAGSVPGGVTATYLERLSKLVRAGTRRMIVDSSDQALVALLAGKPDLIKPNEAEMEALMGRPASLEEQIAFARDDLIGGRMAPGGRVLLSQGRAGAVLISGSGEIWARPPEIRVLNPVGCGDALLAGFVDGWLNALDPAASLRQAVAFGAAAALQPVAGVVGQGDVERLLADVVVGGNGHGAERQRTMA